MQSLSLHLWVLGLAMLCLHPTINAQCPPSGKATNLYANNTQAPFYAGAHFFHTENSDAGYVPDYLSIDDFNVASIFSAALWIGAIDANAEKRVSIAEYGWATDRSDYRPGPIDPSSGLAWVSDESCDAFSRVWKVQRHEILSLLADFEDNGQIDNGIPASIKSWPSRGNSHFEEVWGVALPDFDLAPFFDRNDNQIYEPSNGEYPIIGDDFKDVIPGELLWAVFNDQVEHTESSSMPLNIEIQLTAWAFECTDAAILNQTTFTRHHITYYGEEALEGVRVGLWVDPDLGCFTDDYTGCNPALNTAYTYNADAIDGDNGLCTAGVNSFAEVLPVQAITLLNQPMESFSYITNGGVGTPPPGITDPGTVVEYYNYLDGKWRDGSVMTVGDLGFGGDGEATNFLFFDNPNDPNGWSQFTARIGQFDFRTLSTTRIESLQPNESITFDASYSIHRDEEASHLEAVNIMEEEIPFIQAFYDGGFQSDCGQVGLCSDDCVWPGDANKDGIANHKDVLAVGIGVGQSLEGEARTSSNGSWRPQIANDWSETLANGTNYKHVDCDGNGVILQGEKFTIEQNYDRKTPDYVQTLEPPVEDGTITLTLSSSKSIIDYGGTPGQRVLPVQITLDAQDTELYGIAFTLDFDTELMDASRFFIADVSNDNFLLEGNAPIELIEGSVEAGKLDIALCRSDLQNVSGEGRLAVLNVTMANDFATGNLDGTLDIPFTITDVRAINADEERISVQANTLNFLAQNVTVDSTLVAVKELSAEDWAIDISPNPTKGDIVLESSERIDRIILLDSQGRRQRVLNSISSQKRQSITLPPLSQGLYFLQCVNEEGKSTTKKLVIEQ